MAEKISAVSNISYDAKYPTPKGATFTGLLDEAMGKSKKIPSADDDEGYVLSIQS